MKTFTQNSHQKAHAVVIWLHGLGANADDMLAAAQALPSTLPIQHVCIDAPIRPVTINNNMPMPAWYNILGMQLTDREDRNGILESQRIIESVIAQQIQAGFKAEQIFLAGFSQGGAMALFTGLNYRPNLAGIISLSAYLPLRDTITDNTLASTPIFIGYGAYDPIVQPAWTEASANWIQQHSSAKIKLQKYPIEHSICAEELNDLAAWLEISLKNSEMETVK